LKDGGFSSSLEVLNGGLKINLHKATFDQNIIIFYYCKILLFLVIKSLDPDPEMRLSQLNLVIWIQNTDLKTRSPYSENLRSVTI
jgi:hypothetical protein